MSQISQKAQQKLAFSSRHIGPNVREEAEMLAFIGFDSLDRLTEVAVPKQIQDRSPLDIPEPASEAEALAELRAMMGQNKVFRSMIGMGYYDCHVPAVISRNILENPAWYTQYTPYQAEIAQGRLEALLNYQTMISDLTSLPIANASLLDEATAAAEAMALALNSAKSGQKDLFYIADSCHPQTIEVVATRAKALGVAIKIDKLENFDFAARPAGLLLQYPTTDGSIADPSQVIAAAKSQDVLVAVATDLLALTLLRSPGELGADIAVGSSQRFGVPLGYGGPHAGFFATRNELMRKVPGRIVGVSKDTRGHRALRLALQTREQHIRRDKATSNICTAQVLLAIMSSMYAVYHGPQGIKDIGEKTHACACLFANAAAAAGFELGHAEFFDTVVLKLSADQLAKLKQSALAAELNFRYYSDGVSVAFDEKSDGAEVQTLLQVFGIGEQDLAAIDSQTRIPEAMSRQSSYLNHPTFNKYHSETEMMRYIRKLEGRDLSLTRSMIPLGSCTMKLNAAVELQPISWTEVNGLHPFAPLDQAQGYQTLFQQLEKWLAEATGFDAISLQPNSGAQGEFAGLMTIAKYHEERGDTHRNVCLIPASAHGTNPASAVLAGMKVVVVRCDSDGNVDLEDLRAKAAKHQTELSALMVTYPSTHGVFEDGIIDICDIVHNHGGQVYMDGANLNAQLGLCRPGKFGPDVCHLNLHKTFCIPHGGGGPGVGPIGVKEHLAPYLPNHPVVDMNIKRGVGPVSAAPWGSPSILPISWMYIRMMGEAGLRKASQTAILNANYMAKKIEADFPVVYKGREGLVAHECIIDLKPVKKSADISVDDIAKRLIDYGYHAPTVSWPVPNSMMIEPTESESKEEIDRFCMAMSLIREEISRIEKGEMNRDQNPLKMAPHTADMVTADDWPFEYPRSRGAFPAPWLKESKFWPFVSRVDNAFGDRNLVCSCPSLDQYES